MAAIALALPAGAAGQGRSGGDGAPPSAPPVTAGQGPRQPSTPAPVSTVQLKQTVERYLRHSFAWGPSFKVQIGEPRESTVPNFYELDIEVTYPDGNSNQGSLYVSKDGRHVIRGEVQQTDVDPFAAVRSQIKLEGQPFKGPADARVVVVEYADFQCPSCRQMYLEIKQLLPRYPQVKFVFKDFPLDHIHPWARNAALAGRCAYRQDPGTFWKLHDALFDNQQSITAENHWQRFADLATAAGLDAQAFRVCMTSPEAKAEVDASVQEAISLRVANTPTLFINGRRFVGGTRADLENILRYELNATPR
jgi:protein-disulfide isomerase